MKYYISINGKFLHRGKCKYLYNVTYTYHQFRLPVYRLQTTFEKNIINDY